MSTAKKTRAQMTGSNQAGSPRSTESFTPRRSSRSRKSADTNGFQENIIPAQGSQRRGRKSAANGEVIKSPNVSSKNQSPNVSSKNQRRSARLQNSESTGLPALNTGSPLPSKAKDRTNPITPEVADLNPKESSGRRRASQRRSKNTPVNSRVNGGKRKLSHNDEESPVPEKVIIADSGEISELVSECSFVTTADVHAQHDDADVNSPTKARKISETQCESNGENPVPKKRRKSRESGHGVTDTASESQASKDPHSIDKVEQHEIEVEAHVSPGSCNTNSEDTQTKDAVSARSSDICRDEMLDVEAFLQYESAEAQKDAVNEPQDVQRSDSQTESTENAISKDNSEKDNTIQQQQSTSLHSEDKTDPIDALVRDLAEKQTKDEAEECPQEGNNGKKNKDKRRRSSFIRGRLSQAAVTLDVEELSNCIPLEFTSDHRLEILMQKAARHTLDRLMEEFAEIDEDSHFVTDALETTGDEIAKLKTENAFVHATNKNSFLPHPENIDLENRISQIQRTITRLNSESEEWDKVIEKHKLAAEEAQSQSEKEQVLMVEGQSSGAVQNNVELFRRTKQQFVTMMDTLKIITKAVDHNNDATSSVIEKVVQENGVKLLGERDKMDPMKLIQSLPIMECRESLLSPM